MKVDLHSIFLEGKKFKIWQFIYFARQIHLLPYLSYQGSNSQWDWKNIWSPGSNLSHNLPSFQLSLPDSHVSLQQVHHGLNSFEPSFFISIYQTMPLTLCSFLIWSKLHRASLQTLFSVTLSFAEPTSHNPKPKWFFYVYIEKMIEDGRKNKNHTIMGKQLPIQPCLYSQQAHISVFSFFHVVFSIWKEFHDFYLTNTDSYPSRYFRHHLLNEALLKLHSLLR